ncbi:FecCD family ABC transporter permease [Microbacterium thalassium]|uniref:Iron complex transport system permease protein n=1 Tax=Microbacterium thalassium TaxID=362649 RepID=A0A7X0FMM9_9MICO|nr:iron chelate uptake ABC transporter family permease subunit [Microbacterium thalassium]MBB6389845.1 iron complex transport system permease protein [Microbacterium thalassium]
MTPTPSRTPSPLGRRSITGAWVVSAGPITVRIRPRSFWVGIAAIAVLLAAGLVTLTHGTLALSPAEVVAALFGQGEAPAVRTVQGRRLPRLITAATVGGALGIAGAVFQSVSRNALGSPDIIGFTSGAAAGAVIQVTVFGGDVVATALSAIAGGLVTALLVYGLARRGGITGGLRLVLVGIGVGAIASAITALFVVRAELDRAVSAQQWLAGSLLGRGWPHAWSVTVAVLVLIVPIVIVARRLTLIEMGDDLAGSIGVRVERTRFIAVILGVLLTGVAVAATGPIAFIALAAPQIVGRLVRSGGVHVLTSALLGAILLVTADLLSQAVDIGLRTPVGTVTALLGGVYLVWMLARRA